MELGTETTSLSFFTTTVRGNVHLPGMYTNMIHMIHFFSNCGYGTNISKSHLENSI